MFTGIIQEVGKIKELKSLGGGIRIRVSAQSLARRLKVNDSVAVNGVCQTVVEKSAKAFTVVAVEETLRKTTFGEIRAGQEVNLELPLKMNDLLGGHLLMGHVDTVGRIIRITREKTGTDYVIGLPAEFLRYIVYTGSVAVDGVSLTVAEVLPDAFRVAIIPHTMEKTIFHRYSEGEGVNIEVDIIGKYVEKLLAGSGGGEVKKVFPSVEELKEQGF